MFKIIYRLVFLKSSKDKDSIPTYHIEGIKFVL